jgi:hypothetical protein
MKSRLLGLVGIVAILGGVLAAQAPTNPVFEVASVKPNNVVPGPTAPSRIALTTGDRAVIENSTLRNIIAAAYSVNGPSLIGPTWINDERFDINTKTEGPTSADQAQAGALARLLAADRAITTPSPSVAQLCGP